MVDETEIKFRFTPKGRQISAASLGGKEKIEFTKAAASIDLHINDTDDDVANIIDLDNKKQVVSIADTIAVDDNVVQIPIKFEKNKITEDYQMNTVGIYVNYQGKETLYAFGALKYPLYMHHTDDSSVLKLYTYITVGAIDNVVIKTNDAENITREELDQALVGKANVIDVTTQVSDAVTEAKKYTDDQAKTKVDVDTFNTALKAKANKDEVNSNLAGKLDKTEFNTFKDNNNRSLNSKVENAEFSKFKTDNQKVLDTKLDKTTYANDKKQLDEDIKNAGKVKSASVNGKEKILPDATGNLDLKVDIPLTSANGKTGDVQIPVFAPNLLTGTSDQLQTIGGNGLLSDTVVSIKTGEKYTLNAWIDNTKGNSGDDKVSIWYLDSTGKAITMSSGNAISDGQAGYSSVTVTFTSPNVTKITAHISGSAVPVKEAKLAKWQDINTPPDMTWMPHTEDIKQYTDDKVDKLPKSASVNGGKQILPDNKGNLPLSVPMFAPNLLKDTSDTLKTVTKGDHATSWGEYRTDFVVGDKYSVFADIEWSGSGSGTNKDYAGIYMYAFDSNGNSVKGGNEDVAITFAQKKGAAMSTLTIPAGTVMLRVLTHNHSTTYDVGVKNIKLAKWTNSSTPPDKTWLPNPEDAKQYTDDQTSKLPKRVNNKAPDSTGNISLTASDVGSYDKANTYSKTEIENKGYGTVKSVEDNTPDTKGNVTLKTKITDKFFSVYDVKSLDTLMMSGISDTMVYSNSGYLYYNNGYGRLLKLNATNFAIEKQISSVTYCKKMCVSKSGYLYVIASGVSGSTIVKYDLDLNQISRYDNSSDYYTDIDVDNRFNESVYVLNNSGYIKRFSGTAIANGPSDSVSLSMASGVTATSISASNNWIIVGDSSGIIRAYSSSLILKDSHKSGSGGCNRLYFNELDFNFLYLSNTGVLERYAMKSSVISYKDNVKLYDLTTGKAKAVSQIFMNDHDHRAYVYGEDGIVYAIDLFSGITRLSSIALNVAESTVAFNSETYVLYNFNYEYFYKYFFNKHKSYNDYKAAINDLDERISAIEADLQIISYP